MARTKRFFSACWIKTRHGHWLRRHVGKPSLDPPPLEASPLRWTHQLDRLEAIIGDKIDGNGEHQYLAKWQGLPVSKASWENRYRFSTKEKAQYSKQKADLRFVEDALNNTKTEELLYLRLRLRMLSFDDVKIRQTASFKAVANASRPSKQNVAALHQQKKSCHGEAARCRDSHVDTGLEARALMPSKLDELVRTHMPCARQSSIPSS